MEIRLVIPDDRKALSLIEFIRSFSPTTQIQVVPETAAGQPASTPAEAQPAQPSFFDRHYGSMPNLDVAAFEAYLDETRRGWDEREAAHNRIRANPADNPYQS